MPKKVKKAPPVPSKIPKEFKRDDKGRFVSKQIASEKYNLYLQEKFSGRKISKKKINKEFYRGGILEETLDYAPAISYGRKIEQYQKQNKSLKVEFIDRQGKKRKFKNPERAKREINKIISELWREAKENKKKGGEYIPQFLVYERFDPYNNFHDSLMIDFSDNNFDMNDEEFDL